MNNTAKQSTRSSERQAEFEWMALDYSVSWEKQAAICLPSAEEYRRLLNDPETEPVFDEDGFVIGGVMRAKSAATLRGRGSPGITV